MIKKTYVVGLTGGIGSGKTTISNIFKDLGVPVIDADVISRDVSSKDPFVISTLIEHYGELIVLPSGELDRKKLRQIIFNSSKEKKFLENLLHPIIRKRLIDEINKVNHCYCIVVVPLLFEKGFDSFVDRVLCVDLEEELQIKRTCERDKIDENLVRQIMVNQLPREKRNSLSNDIIYNSEDFTKKYNNVVLLDQKYRNLAKNG